MAPIKKNKFVSCYILRLSH